MWPCGWISNVGGFVGSSRNRQEERGTPLSTADAVLVCIQPEFRPESPFRGSSPALSCLRDDLWLNRPHTRIRQLDELSVQLPPGLSFR